MRRIAGRAWEGGGTGLYRARSARRLRGRLGAVAALWMLGLGGAAVALGAFMAAPDPPPTPSSGALPAGPGGTGPTLPASTPTRIDIDAIDVHAPVEAAGVDERGEAVVPPLTAPHQANWYKLGASPGEAGNAVILGHVDSRKVGAAVFYDLGRLKAGALVNVTRADGIVAVFKVDGVALYQKASFPVGTVYGPNARAGLRLVTCGGTFDAKTPQLRGQHGRRRDAGLLAPRGGRRPGGAAAHVHPRAAAATQGQPHEEGGARRQDDEEGQGDQDRQAQEVREAQGHQEAQGEEDQEAGREAQGDEEGHADQEAEAQGLAHPQALTGPSSILDLSRSISGKSLR